MAITVVLASGLHQFRAPWTLRINVRIRSVIVARSRCDGELFETGVFIPYQNIKYLTVCKNTNSYGLWPLPDRLSIMWIVFFLSLAVRMHKSI